MPITLILYTALKLLLLSFESDTCLILKKTAILYKGGNMCRAAMWMKKKISTFTWLYDHKQCVLFDYTQPSSIILIKKMY